MTSKGCDLFLSGHSNAVGSGVDDSVDYVAVYHLVDDNTTEIDDISFVIMAGMGIPISPAFSMIEIVSFAIKAITTASLIKLWFGSCTCYRRNFWKNMKV